MSLCRLATRVDTKREGPSPKFKQSASGLRYELRVGGDTHHWIESSGGVAERLVEVMDEGVSEQGGHSATLGLVHLQTAVTREWSEK